MSILADRVVPALLGPDARRLVVATWLGQLTDGLALVSAPLAVASLTRSPFLVALAVALHRLPVLLLSPYAALLADLVNRRFLVVAADAARAGVLLVLAGLLALGVAPVALLLLAMAGLGLLETVADSARGPLLPMLVRDPAAQEVVGARLDGGFVLGTQLGGPVLGALLFVPGAAVPFAVQAVVLAGAVALLSRLRVPGPSRGPLPPGVRHPVRSGLRRIAVDPHLSGLVLVGLAAQAAWAAGWSLLVVYAAQQLGLHEVGFGLLVAAGAAGGLAGVVLRPLVDPLARALPGLTPARLVLAGLALEAIGHLALSRLHTPWIAAATLAVLGALGFVAADLARDLRRRRTAADGTSDVVAAASTALGLAASVAGCLLGGVLAEIGGISTAYAGGGVLLAAALVLLGRRSAAL